MKKTLFLSFFITLLLLIACGNKLQQNNHGIEVSPDNPQTYTMIMIWEPSDESKPFKYTASFYFESREEAYLFVYEKLCLAALGCDCNNKNTNNSKVKSIRFKLLNEKNEDILPIIDFPNKSLKEDWKWKEILEISDSAILDCNSVRINQPRLNVNDSMTVFLDIGL